MLRRLRDKQDTNDKRNKPKTKTIGRDSSSARPEEKVQATTAPQPDQGAFVTTVTGFSLGTTTAAVTPPPVPLKKNRVTTGGSSSSSSPNPPLASSTPPTTASSLFPDESFLSDVPFSGDAMQSGNFGDLLGDDARKDSSLGTAKDQQKQASRQTPLGGSTLLERLESSAEQNTATSARDAQLHASQGWVPFSGSGQDEEEQSSSESDERDPKDMTNNSLGDAAHRDSPSGSSRSSTSSSFMNSSATDGSLSVSANLLLAAVTRAATDELADTQFYKAKVLPFLFQTNPYTINPFLDAEKARPCPRSFTYQELLQAKYRLDRYLNAHLAVHDSVHNSLRSWSDGISSRIDNNTLNETQRGELVQLIYTNLTIAHVYDCKGKQNISQEAITKAIGSPDAFLMDRARQLNEKTSTWKGWKIAAGLGLIFLVGIPLVIVAGVSIASGYDVPLPPFFATMASWNGAAVIGALVYMFGYAKAKKSQWKQEAIREVEKKSCSQNPAVVSSDKAINKGLCNQYGRDIAIAVGASIGSGLSIVASGLIKQIPSMKSASLSLGSISSTKAKVTLGEAALNWGNLGAAGITTLMLMVGGAGIHAIYQGFTMIKREAWNKCRDDQKVRALGSTFFDAVAPQPASQSGSSAVSGRPLRLGSGPTR